MNKYRLRIKKSSGFKFVRTGMFHNTKIGYNDYSSSHYAFQILLDKNLEVMFELDVPKKTPIVLSEYEIPITMDNFEKQLVKHGITKRDLVRVLTTAATLLSEPTKWMSPS